MTGRQIVGLVDLSKAARLKTVAPREWGALERSRSSDRGMDACWCL